MNYFMKMAEFRVCRDSAEILQLVGTVLTILKIAIPLIIIILGIVDLAKAITSSKPEEIKKSATGLLWRFVGAVFIFFLPAIVMTLFKLVGPWNRQDSDVQADFEVCRGCIVRPRGEACSGAVVLVD